MIIFQSALNIAILLPIIATLHALAARYIHIMNQKKSDEEAHRQL